MNSSRRKNQIVEALEQSYGAREARNIALYYIDATLDMNIDEDKFATDLQKLIYGIPVQQVVGLSFFYGHKFYVDEHVLIPRPETEELVHWIITDSKNRSDLTLLDIGTGSGCIILSIANKLNLFKAFGIDISTRALAVATQNAYNFNIQVDFECCDIMINDLNSYPDLDIIVSNPPYILQSETSMMSKSTLMHEPKEALFVEGTDPLIFYYRIIELGKKKIKPGGHLYFEMSHLHWEPLEIFMKKEELNYHIMKDLQGQMRMMRIDF